MFPQTELNLTERIVQLLHLDQENAFCNKPRSLSIQARFRRLRLHIAGRTTGILSGNA